MVMSFLVPTSAFFRCSRIQLTTAACYWITEVAKVFIAVTLFLIESLVFSTCLTQFLYSKVALQGTYFVILAK